MTNKRLSGLALLSTERHLAENIDFESTINRFASMKSRRKKIDINKAISMMLPDIGTFLLLKVSIYSQHRFYSKLKSSKFSLLKRDSCKIIP